MPATQTTLSFIANHLKEEASATYKYTAMVSHLGKPVSFAMRDDGRIFYSVLDVSGSAQNTPSNEAIDGDNDKYHWSRVNPNSNSATASMLHFPAEISQVGYAVAPNRKIDQYDSQNQRIIDRYDSQGKPLDKAGEELTKAQIANQVDRFYSSTARLGAVAPFQALSDGKYIYLFRQSIAKGHANNIQADSGNPDSAIVNNTLLVDRFILSGAFLKPSREIRYQRSRHKTQPASRKDTLSTADVEGNPFYEPTRELAFANNLQNGNFCVLLLPGADAEEQRWQIFTGDSVTHKVNSFNIRFDGSVAFDASDAETLIDAFVAKYKLDKSLTVDVQAKIREGKSDVQIADILLGGSAYNAKGIPQDAFAEVIYTIRTGVSKDDFTPVSASEWPLIEYENGTIKPEYLQNGKVKDAYAFQGTPGELTPRSTHYQLGQGMSSCYYYQQEMGADNKPMKNKACVMLSLGLEDMNATKYIGILNYAVAASGRLGRLTGDTVNLADINVQALDENPYNTLDQIPRNQTNGVAWQQPQKMGLIDIDPDGLSISGGVLKFAYTSADIAASAGYSDAAQATEPYVFDDSLGRVNLYFKGKNNNFFVLYFNPTGSAGITITDQSGSPASPALSLEPRLNRDMRIDVTATVPNNSNSCTLVMKSGTDEVERWSHLPRRLAQIAQILNGTSDLPLGTLDPLGLPNDPRTAYKKSGSGNGNIKIRTTLDNNLVFNNVQSAYADVLADGKEHTIASLNGLSAYLANNTRLQIAKKTFTLVDQAVRLKADLLHKAYLSGIVQNTADMDKLWNYLQQQPLVQVDTATPDRGSLKSASITGTRTSLRAMITDQSIDALSLQLLQEGSEPDKKARRSGLRESLIALLLDVAKIRVLSFTVQDANTQKVDQLQAGLAVNLAYDYKHFTCTPANLGGISAGAWEHPRSYLFKAGVGYDQTATTEIDNRFNYQYVVNHAIGQWEDWEAGLALEFKPASATDGSLLNTNNTAKLDQLQPTEKGLSLEAWIKPAAIPGAASHVIYYKKGSQHYSLGIEKDSADKYKCAATLGQHKYTTQNSFPFKVGGKDIWKHLTFTHKKYWGYQLASGQTVNCGNDDSLHLDGEFTLEVLVKPDAAGTLLEKKDEYSLSIHANKEVAFNWAGKNCLQEQIVTNGISTQNKPRPLDAFGQFYKITLIRSRNKPQTQPTTAEYPVTGGDGGEKGSGTKWYQDKSSYQIIKGIAEKQDQMDNSIQTNMFGAMADQSSDPNPEYHHTLVITKGDNDKNPKEWTSTTRDSVQHVESYKDFTLGGNNFGGIFASVRIWNRALSIGEAKKLAEPENKTGLLSHWRMAEGKDRHLYDNVGENHGVADGGLWTDSPQTNQPGQFQFYVDGTLIQHNISTGQAVDGIDQFSIGGYKKPANVSQNHFQGALEEIRIWNLPRSNEQITDNAFGRLKGEWEQLLANYTFDTPMVGNQVPDASTTVAVLTAENHTKLKEVLSTAPVATEIPQIRSALTGVITDYNSNISSRPAVVEYGDVQNNADGTLNGILKRCYAFIGTDNVWRRMTGYKVGNLVSQWYGQAQFAPQVMGYLEGPPPVPAENFPVGKDADVDTYAYKLNNATSFNQAEEIAYNYSTSKEAGWNVAVNAESDTGIDIETVLAPLGLGISFKATAKLAAESSWQTSGNRSESYARGVSVNTDRAFSAALAGYDNGKSGSERYYKLGNTGYALVKSKTADIYLLRLAHNNALVNISWQPNPDIPEDINIIPFPINPLYTKQGTLDGKFAGTTDDHYPQAQGAYGEYSYYKPREAYQLKKQIEREKAELKHYFEDSFDVSKTNAHFQAAAATTGVIQAAAFFPAVGPLITSAFNQVAGQLATQVGYNNTSLKDDFSQMGSQRNLINTYVWTVEGGFYAESTEVAETQQETYANDTDLSLGGALGVSYSLESGGAFEQKSLFSSGSSFTLTKSKTKESSSSFGLDVSVDIPTSPRYQYTGSDGRTLSKGLINPGTVDAYRFMSFYLEPKGKHFTDLFSQVIDPIWLDESADPNAQALRQAAGNINKAKPCWRIMHRVTYVSRILPEFLLRQKITRHKLINMLQ
ncbi:MAG: hypothetical protein GKR94_18370 [Gammaproteobacteria bacterium]|nr:hypothetical protein [Rhizobiaceae bacterium]NKC14073.1 hypothetical protein [Gammaproteobacteria bacterium]